MQRLFTLHTDPEGHWTGRHPDGRQILVWPNAEFEATFSPDGTLLDSQQSEAPSGSFEQWAAERFGRHGFTEGPIQVRVAKRDDDHIYLLQSHPVYHIWTGCLENGRQMLLCPLDETLRVFSPEGSLLETRERETWGPPMKNGSKNG